MSVQIFAGILDYCATPEVRSREGFLYHSWPRNDRSTRASQFLNLIACSGYGYRPVEVKHQGQIWVELRQPIYKCFSTLSVIIMAVIWNKVFSHNKTLLNFEIVTSFTQVCRIDLHVIIPGNFLTLDAA